MRIITTIILLVAAATISQANPVQISINGEADITALGYIQGQNYTFNWLINESYLDNGYENLQWATMLPGDSSIFSAFSGDGITGTFKQGYTGGAWNHIAVTDSGHLDIVADGNLGLQVNGVNLAAFEAVGVINAGFSIPQVYTDPTEYFTSYIGTYQYQDSSPELILYSLSGEQIQFTPSTVTIAAIPEPSSAILIAAIGGLGVFVRRRFLIV